MTARRNPATLARLRELGAAALAALAVKRAWLDSQTATGHYNPRDPEYQAVEAPANAALRDLNRFIRSAGLQLPAIADAGAGGTVIDAGQQFFSYLTADHRYAEERDRWAIIGWETGQTRYEYQSADPATLRRMAATLTAAADHLEATPHDAVVDRYGRPVTA